MRRSAPPVNHLITYKYLLQTSQPDNLRRTIADGRFFRQHGPGSSSKQRAAPRVKSIRNEAFHASTPSQVSRELVDNSRSDDKITTVS
jgi:hypothetical protein